MNRITDTENRLVIAKGEESGGEIKLEVGVNICKF